jgi:ABC-2 type transport system ATP-binding protein
MNGIAIQTRDLTKKFGDFTAVDRVSIGVQDREIFGFLGPNGAGKSTTIRLLCTLCQPTSGSATVAGYDVVKQDSEVRKHIGLVSEKLIMYNELTARENLKLFGKLYDLPNDVLAERIDELLRFVRMEKWADARISTFSTGMKQRINVIRAMVNQPEILFLDEPTLGLDPQSTVEIRALVKRINTDLGTTMILTTHSMVDADMLCHRIGIIDKGKIVALDTAPNLKRLVSGAEFTTFDFDIANLSPVMISASRSLGCVVSLSQEDSTHIKVRAKGEDSFDSLIDALRANHARILSAKSVEPTLEDVFLHLTGREVAETASEVPKPKMPSGRFGRPIPTGRIR